MSTTPRDRRPLTRAEVETAIGSVGGCEHCDSRSDTPFYWVLDATVGAPGARYTLPETRCPVCSAEILTDSLVLWN